MRILRSYLALTFLLLITQCAPDKKSEADSESADKANPEDVAFLENLQWAKDRGISIEDLHVHLKGGLDLETAIKNAEKYGFTYGFAVNCGLAMGIETEDSLRTYMDEYQRYPGTYHAMQAEGREWLDIFSEESISRFDYAFTDAMTWTNDNGRRMRLWIPEETEIGDPEDFMDQLVNRIERILTEPIDIYVNATYLPDEINDQYDILWTEERMDRVIRALKENEVALEISARYKIPSEDFIMRAKKSGIKFTFGTNNSGKDDLGRLEYCLEMAKACDLGPDDLWSPEMKE